MSDLHAVLDQYLEGAITYAELISILTAHYLEAQNRNPNTCSSCGSDLSARLK